MQLSDRRIFALLGEVVDGNPTEEMIQAAFTAVGLPWKYVSIPVTPGSFEAAWAAARALGFAGLNVTKPYKIEAARLADRLTPAAAAMGAVNCVYRADEGLVGDNTDGRGLVRAVAGTGRIVGASVVVLGAGGAARAVAVELALAGAREIVVAARSEEAGRSLVEAIRATGTATARFERWAGELVIPVGCALLVNATSVGMFDPDERPAVDLSSAGAATVVADVVITSRPTALLVEATRRGLTTVHGNEMLVRQAAIGFELWTGREAPLPVLRTALAAALGL